MNNVNPIHPKGKNVMIKGKSNRSASWLSFTRAIFLRWTSMVAIGVVMLLQNCTIPIRTLRDEEEAAKLAY